MGKRLKDYIEYIEKRLDENMTEEERQQVKADLLIQISFFQHERMIHLIVTVTFALLSLLTLFLLFFVKELLLIVLLALLLILLIPYIWHYYKLENGVQRLYKSYDKL